MKKYRLFIWVILLLQLSSCDDVFEYSPYVIDFDEHETNLTQKNIDCLLSNDVSDTIIIALAGDSHRFYDESEKLVSTINQHYNIDFLFIPVILPIMVFHDSISGGIIFFQN